MPKVRSFTVKFKLEVIDWFILNGRNVARTARQFGVDRKSVREWLGLEANLRILSFGVESKVKREQSGSEVCAELDMRVLHFMLRQRAIGRTVSNDELKQRAFEEAQTIDGLQGFQGSDGWLRYWKKRNNLLPPKQPKEPKPPKAPKPKKSKKKSNNNAAAANNNTTTTPTTTMSSTPIPISNAPVPINNIPNPAINNTVTATINPGNPNNANGNIMLANLNPNGQNLMVNQLHPPLPPNLMPPYNPMDAHRRMMFPGPPLENKDGGIIPVMETVKFESLH